MNKNELDESRIEELALRAIGLAKDSIIIRYRFFDRPLAAIKLIPEKGSAYVSSAASLKYDPEKLLCDYMEDENFVIRLMLHVMFHGIFMHFAMDAEADRHYWDIACDIAAENAVLALGSGFSRLGDTDVAAVLARLTKWVPRITARHLYREFMVGGISSDSAKEYERLFSLDVHYRDADPGDADELTVTAEQWEKIARRVAAELKSFSKDVRGSETILLNINELSRRKYDYDDIIRRFAVMSEEIKVSPDEYDYIYYTYGLSMYGNMPLIEPIEYTEEKKIKDFVIAVDTSASVKGKLVEGFLGRTYDLLSQSLSFSESMNVHVIQCDSEITSDVVIKDRNEIVSVAEKLQVKGFGATDFRPVFWYVEELLAKKEFTDLKGLIYFTDGYGIYPENPPGYDVMFVFGSEDDFRPPVPGWAISVCSDFSS
ncbi:MAG: VWA-like domain-containing protein [Lachnospiraceae bacterium]|nr:VWA-like domain-containing protein [Lachnospiraceae bacterium]